MRDAQPGAVYLKDYQPPAYLIDATELHFELYEDHALVASRLHMRRNIHSADTAALQLHGEGLELLAVSLDGQPLSKGQYTLQDAIASRSPCCINVMIDPHAPLPNAWGEQGKGMDIK